MKKRLEAELISIAHRILKLKNLKELKQLHSEAQKLYETLSVLKFVEENINIIHPKIDVEDVEQKLEYFFDKSTKIPKSILESNEIVEPLSFNDTISINQEKLVSEETEIENIEVKPIMEIENSVIENQNIDEEEIINKENEPIFISEIKNEIEEPKKVKKSEPVQISFDEFKFVEPIFEKKSDSREDKPIILNEKLSKGINIGLNDKIAFVKHLFNESNEDYNRVLSQINTFDTYFDTVTFINEMVKPDYNNWEDKDEYVLRFLESVEKKFV